MRKSCSIICWVMAVVPFGMLGCSTHPLPQDVSGVSTAEIVRKIRCEAKEGIEEALAKAASQGDVPRKHVERIVSVSTVGFEFKFVMTENNSAVVSELTFQRPSADGDLFRLTLLGSIAPDPSDKTNSQSRANTRIFRVVDKLEDLRKAHCGRVKETRPNLTYPITGSTGMAEVVRTYIELESFTDLQSVGDVTVAGKKEIITFSDKLDFTTTFSAGASLDFQFDTAVGTLRLTKASMAGSASRQDIHSVTVALARDPAPTADPDVLQGARRMMIPMGAMN